VKADDPLRLVGDSRSQFFQEDVGRRSEEVAIDQPALALLVTAIDADVGRGLIHGPAADPDFHCPAGCGRPASVDIETRDDPADRLAGAVAYLEKHAQDHGLLVLAVGGWPVAGSGLAGTFAARGEHVESLWIERRIKRTTKKPAVVVVWLHACYVREYARDGIRARVWEGQREPSPQFEAALDHEPDPSGRNIADRRRPHDVIITFRRQRLALDGEAGRLIVEDVALDILWRYRRCRLGFHGSRAHDLLGFS